jgi:malate/lactate dehydrogenase
MICFYINGKIVVEAAQKAIAYSPDAFFIIVTNPLDVMTLIWHGKRSHFHFSSAESICHSI